LFADKARAALAHGDKDTAPGGEGVGDDARIPDRHGHVQLRIPDLEQQRVAFVAHRSSQHGAGQDVGRPGSSPLDQLRGGQLVTSRAEARVDERRRQKHGGGEGNGETDGTLTAGIHAWANCPTGGSSRTPALALSWEWKGAD